MPRRRYPNRARLASRRTGPLEPAFQSELDRDFAAMKRVWKMIRQGAVRMVGEIGRQY